MKLQVIVWKLHIYWLMLKTGFRPYWGDKWIRSSISIKDHCVILAPITGPVSYIVALHEFGHLYTHKRWGDYWVVQKIYVNMLWGFKLEPFEHDILILSELLADEWAIKHAIGFNREMGRTLKACLTTYYPNRTKLVQLRQRELQLQLEDKSHDYTIKQSSLVPYVLGDTYRVQHYRTRTGDSFNWEPPSIRPDSL